jgi:molybdopterin synthase sulfur carrier subunit
LRVTVLYFAAVRDLAGIDQETIETDARTIADLRRALETKHASLSGRLSAVRLARNERFADEGESIAEGDTIALIPPVAGGS